MLRRGLPLIALSLCTLGSARAQTPSDSLPPLPTLRIPVTQDFQPLQSSTARAYAWSAGATLGTAALGGALWYVLPETKPGGSGYSAEELALGLVLVGILMGPGVGNFTLGARDDLARGWEIRYVGLVTSLSLFGGGLGVCALVESGETCEVGAVLLIGSGVALVGSTLGAAAYDLATIPRNGRRARLRRRGPALALGYDARAEAPALTFRIGL